MFFSFSKASPLFGLDIGSSAIKVVQLKEKKTGYSLEKFGIKSLAPEMIVDGTVMDASSVGGILKELLSEQKIKLKDVAISISGHSVIVKKISLPAMTEDELEESIKWEAEQYIPFDINDVNIDFHILGTSDGQDGQPQMNVLLVAAKKDKLNEYTALVADAGLTPRVVDVDAFAIENMYGVNYGVQETEVVALVNIGASVMNINILKNTMSSFTRDISIGGNRYTETIQKELNLGYQDAEQAKRVENPEGVNPEALSAVINTVNTEVAGEITRSIDYFKTTTMQENIDKVVLCGGAARSKGLVALLSERLGVPVELANPFNQIEIDPKLFNVEQIQEMAPQAAVGVGLAIRKMGDR
ncbi:MAG TPA: type IV pilus assembly protein PilM [Nitrospiria bacterium]|nr:type IV pilus assembly protein PilM [Nitrospiria bacterium]HUK57524.1 type IV pilus assembly protein PilM [Nitrospiria bacterium]